MSSVWGALMSRDPEIKAEQIVARVEPTTRFGWLWLVFFLLGYVLGTAVFVNYFGFTRTISFELERGDTETPLALMWSSGERQNGVWLVPEFGEARQQIRLPSYALDGLWLESAGDKPETLSIREPRIAVALFGLPVRDRRLDVPAATTVAELEQNRRAYAVILSRAEPIEFAGRLDVSRSAFAVVVLFSMPFGLLLYWMLVIPLRVGCRPSYQFGQPSPPNGAGLRRVWLWMKRASLVVVVLAVCAAGRLALMEVRPAFMAGDSVDYIDGAEIFLETGTFEHFTVLRPAGYPLVVAAALQFFPDANLGLLVLQSVIGLLTALCLFAIAAQLTSFWVALTVLVLVACDPVLLVYEHYVLTENLAAFWVAVVSLVFVTLIRLTGGQRAFWGVLLLCGVAGILFGGGVYIRGNLRIVGLVLFAAAVLVLFLRMKPHVAVIGTLLMGSLGAVVAYPQLDPAQSLSVLRWNRVLFIGQSGLADRRAMNQAGSLAYERWRELDRKATEEMLLPYMVVYALNDEVWVAQRFESLEAAYEAYAHEVVFRQGPNFLPYWAVWFGQQLGLPDGVRDENDVWSRAVRGQQVPPNGENWLMERPAADRLTEVTVMAFTRPAPEADGRAAVTLSIFNGLYVVTKAVRYGLPLLVMLGALSAWRARDWPVVGLALVVLVNAGFLATVAMAGGTRFGAPFLPLLWLLGGLGLVILGRVSVRVTQTVLKNRS